MRNQGTGRRQGHPGRRPGSEPYSSDDLSPAFTLVLRGGNGVHVDNIDALLLNCIAEKKSITEAAKSAGISYRNAWDRIDRLGKSLGRKAVLAEHGGNRGGSARLSAEGETLLAEYRKMNTYLFGALGDKDFWQHIGYRLSARNRIRARIVEVNEGPITSEIKMKIDSQGGLTSIISNEAVRDLRLSPGDEVEAIIKATEIVIAKPESSLHTAGTGASPSYEPGRK